jgi:pre-mRNA-splicing factor ATP-dependent RNA helicase DHX15/PRP43
MQCAHLEVNKYLTVKDNQAVSIHPSSSVTTNPPWIIFHEFVVTKKNYVRTVTEIDPEWLLDVSPKYYDMRNFPDGEMKRVLVSLINKRETLKRRKDFKDKK